MRIYRKGDRELRIDGGELAIVLLRAKTGGGYYVRERLGIMLPFYPAHRHSAPRRTLKWSPP